MKLIFTMSHPAHYHLLKNLINRSLESGFIVKVLITNKDILEELVSNESWNVENYFPEGRRISWLPTLLALPIITIKTLYRLYKIIKDEKPSLLIGTEATMIYIGFILGIKSIFFNEDDTRATPQNYLFYPFAKTILMPDCCDIGKWKNKKTTYRGYHELAYLHPRYFKPDIGIINKFNPTRKKYFIIRLARLDASHDIGRRGINDSLVIKIINILKNHGNVFITSERGLRPEFERYRININSRDIFHALYYADMYIGDSQTMAAEAAVLGTPSIRFNDFVGKIGYLNDLEKKYKLTIGIKSTETKKLTETINNLLNTKDLSEKWRANRERMLKDKVDVNEYFYSIIKKKTNLNKQLQQ